MSTRLIIDAERVYTHIRSFDVEIPRSADQQGIGLERNGELVGGVLFERFDGRNIWMHCAGGPRWLNKDLLRASYRYPFIQLGCAAVWVWVDGDNVKSRRLVENLGYVQQTVIPTASKSGGDVIIYRMTKEECRFLP